MIDLGSPFSKIEIHQAFVTEVPQVTDFFNAIPEDQFFAVPENIWSPADNLVHLIKSVSPIVMAMGLPKPALRLRFGKAKHPSRPFEEVRSNYQAFVDAGTAISTAEYEPQITSASADERLRIFGKWDSKNQQLLANLESWDEVDLDFYQLPHPLLGNLTMREMLLFTLHHNVHHMNDVQNLLATE